MSSVDHTPAPSRGPRRLATPRQARVRAGEGGRPEEVGGHAVEAVRESWLVEDRWCRIARCAAATGRS